LKETTIFPNFFSSVDQTVDSTFVSTARIVKKQNKRKSWGEGEKTGGHDTEAPSWIQVLQQQQVRRKAFHLDCSLFKVRGERDKASAGL